MAMIQLASVTGTVATVQEAPPPSVWEQWMPALGGAMAMALLGSLAMAMIKQVKKK